MKRKYVRTSNIEIYRKLNMLKVFSEVSLPASYNIKYIKKILKNIDAGGNSIVVTRNNDNFVIKRNRPLNFEIYFGK